MSYFGHVPNHCDYGHDNIDWQRECHGPIIISGFKEVLRTHILGVYIRSYIGCLTFRAEVEHPNWFGAYLNGEMDSVPSLDIHANLTWEGTSKMSEVFPYDPLERLW